MLTASYYTLEGNQVGDSIPMNTDDIEFATLQALAVEDMELITRARHFVVLGDEKRRLVIGYENFSCM